MGKVLLYSALLLAGMAASQLFDLSAASAALGAVTYAALAYIMIEVGLEFTLDKKRMGQYGLDYAVAATAAAFPWIFCAFYFMIVFQEPAKEAFLVGRFAAPTSAGVLFTMLAAAGLGATWLFRKARILAIFDDLDTILLMIPLKIMIIGWKPELAAVVIVLFALLWMAYRWLHVLKLPVGTSAMVAYAVLIVGLCKAFEAVTHVHLEVLLPAFVLGCMLVPPAHGQDGHAPGHVGWLDQGIKSLFMFLVGASLPKIALEGLSLGAAAGHVLMLTVISNVGKCFPSFCYGKEASLRERIALSIAMFPRGEVGAGVLLVAIGYGMTGLPVALAGLSLALNLILTGLFIIGVRALLGAQPAASPAASPVDVRQPRERARQ